MSDRVNTVYLSQSSMCGYYSRAATNLGAAFIHSNVYSTLLASPKCGVIGFLMLFQTHKFLRKRFVQQFWHYLSFLAFPELAIVCLCIQIECCVSHAIYTCTVCLYILLTLGACALGTVAKMVDADRRRRLPRSVHWRAFDDHGI